MAKFSTNASGAKWWSNFLLLVKIASNKVTLVMVSTHESVLPLAMSLHTMQLDPITAHITMCAVIGSSLIDTS